MIYDLSDINSRAKASPAGFLAECEAVYSDNIGRAAQMIAENRARSPIVLLSGPSSSGKTTTARKIRDRLNEMSIKTHHIEMDDYFRTRSEPGYPRTEDGSPDLESPYCLDLKLLNKHFAMLSHGEEITLPSFDFAAQTQILNSGRTLKLGEGEMVIYEGIHALNPEITGENPDAFRLFISVASDIYDGEELLLSRRDLRLLRRTIRDNSFRGTDAETTVSGWANVCLGEDKNITPYKDSANLQLDTMFPCEACILHDNAARLLKAVPWGEVRFPELVHILAALPRFADVPDIMVAPDSVLREFVGGSVYDA